jgi:hypothetical protein
VVNFPWGALARLQLARADGMQGDTAKAKSTNQDLQEFLPRRSNVIRHNELLLAESHSTGSTASLPLNDVP